jgi:hypothetical protein
MARPLLSPVPCRLRGWLLSRPRCSSRPPTSLASPAAPDCSSKAHNPGFPPMLCSQGASLRHPLATLGNGSLRPPRPDDFMPCTTGPRSAIVAVRCTVARQFGVYVPSPPLNRNKATMAAVQGFLAFLKAQLWSLQRLVQALVVEIGAPSAPALRGRGAEF